MIASEREMKSKGLWEIKTRLNPAARRKTGPHQTFQIHVHKHKVYCSQCRPMSDQLYLLADVLAALIVVWLV